MLVLLWAVIVCNLTAQTSIVAAGLPASTIRVMNTTNVNDSTLAFEVWFKNTSADPVQYATGQFFWDFNKLYLNGTASLKIISSGLPTSFQPLNPLVYLDGPSGQFRFAANSPPGAGNGFTINAGDSVLIMKSALICPNGFAVGQKISMFMRRTTPAVNVTYYLGTVNTSVVTACTFYDEFPRVTAISSGEKLPLPSSFALQQNFPNPFNPSSVIRYQLLVDSRVSLIVYDMTGKQVATLVSGYKTAGYYSVSFNAVNLSSGVYIYRLTAQGTDKASSFINVRKMLLIK